jgi:hypothetical protein
MADRMARVKADKMAVHLAAYWGEHLVVQRAASKAWRWAAQSVRKTVVDLVVQTAVHLVEMMVAQSDVKTVALSAYPTAVHWEHYSVAHLAAWLVVWTVARLAVSTDVASVGPTVEMLADRWAAAKADQSVLLTADLLAAQKGGETVA